MKSCLHGFSAADVSFLASEREGWPNVVTESLACGAPVVGTRVGGIPEIPHSLELDVLVEQTVESIATGIDQALSKRWNHAFGSSRFHIGKQTMKLASGATEGISGGGGVDSFIAPSQDRPIFFCGDPSSRFFSQRASQVRLIQQANT